MNKLKIIKPIAYENLDFSGHLNYLKDQLSCHFEVPGIGRFASGKKHANFHITYTAAKENNIIVENKYSKSKKRVVKV